MTAEIRVNGYCFLLDDEDLLLLEGANLHARRGGRNRPECVYLYARWGGYGEPEFSVARLILGLGHNDRAIQADHVNRDTTDNRRANLRTVTPQEQAWNRSSSGGTDVCVKGHPRDVYTRIVSTSGRPYCSMCSRIWARESYQRRKVKGVIRRNQSDRAPAM